jgi:hypothetical protein
MATSPQKPRPRGDLVARCSRLRLSCRAHNELDHAQSEDRGTRYAGRACALALALCAVFAAARTRRPNFASIALYVATCALGLIQW